MWRRYKEQETHVASSNRTVITAREPRKGTAASSGVGAVGERGRSGARGCAGGARTGKGSPVRLEVECYVLVERSARLELNGYDSVVWHVALEACASSTL